MAGSHVSLKDHWREQRLFLSRIVAAAIIALLLTGLLVTRLVQLQVVDHERFAELSQGNRLHIEPLAPTRGLILDRNGLPIADNLPTWRLVAIPEQVANLSATLEDLERLDLLNSAARETLIELIRSHRGFERVALANLDDAQAARFAVRRHLFPGIDIQEGLIRHYPYGEIAAHAIGYVGSISRADLEIIDRADYAATSDIGKTGVERSYEDLLHGDVGFRQQVVNAQGRVLFDPALGSVPGIEAEGALETRWPTPGRDLVLSLDMRLQVAAYNAMQGLRGALVAIDPSNGDVLALVSTPAFDPNRFAVGLSRADVVALNNDADRPLFNRAVSGRYPPGSTIKPFLGLAGLYNERVNPSESSYCPGHYTLPGQTHRYRDWRPQGHGTVDLHTAIVESCDVYFYKLAVELGVDRIEAFMRSFGFGAATGIDIGGERSGVVPSREWKRQNFAKREDQVWFPGETVIAGIGQGYTLVTPIQLANAVAGLAARGARFRPRLLIGSQDNGSREFVWQDAAPLEPIAGVDPEHWQAIHEAMIGVTTELRGSGRTAMRGTNYTVAGKTGTAQVFSIGQDEEYEAEELAEQLRDHGLFVGYAPADRPSVVVAVVIENGGGSSVAVPIARKFFDNFFSLEQYVARQY